MGEHVDALVTKLRNEGALMDARLASLASSQWEMPVYGEGEIWCARDVLAHLVAAERGHQSIIASVAAGGPGAPQGIDIDVYNHDTVSQLAGRSVPDLLSDLHSVREATIATVAALTDDDLRRTGRHPALGENALLADMVRLIPMHVKMHLRDFQRTFS